MIQLNQLLIESSKSNEDVFHIITVKCDSEVLSPSILSIIKSNTEMRVAVGGGGK